jgi:maltose O-acetyltransferase
LARQWHAANERAIALRRYNIDPTVRWGLDTLIYGDGEISIGEGTYLGRHCYVAAHPAGARISIGAHCAISHNVHIRTATYRSAASFAEALGAPPTYSDVRIGDYVWIGANVFIREGVTVGDNSILGANSVVIDDVPPNCIAAGVPARVVSHKRAGVGENVQAMESTVG